MRARSIALACRSALLGLLLAARVVSGQEIVGDNADLADRPISSVRLEGVKPADEQFVRNNLRSAVGDPFDAQTVREDVDRLYKLGRFRFVTAEAGPREDGSVEIVFALVEQPIIRAVQTIGNKAITDQELRSVVRQVPGGPRDNYLIERAERDIKALYRRKGFYLTDVSIDESNLEERGLLIFNVIEGPRVRVRAIVFDGARSFTARQLSSEIKTRTHMFLFRQGVLDEDVIAEDEASLDRFYKDRGFLDVRIGHTVALSPDNTEVKVTFQISEGRVYTLRTVATENVDNPGEPLEVFSPEQLAALIELQPGDVYSRDRLRRSIEVIEDAYGIMGFLDVRVSPYELRSGPDPQVDLLLDIDEGQQFKVGMIRINGNSLTKEKVIRRLMRVHPGRPYDTVQLEKSERLIRQTRLFNVVRMTIQDPDPENPEYRDLLVEVTERNTGSVNFGLAVGSDSGVFGEFSLVQDNFDIADTPKSLRELVTGRAFRGAGQRFNMTFRPGNEIFQYVVGITEPHLFESDYSLSLSGAYRKRQFSDFDEERVTGSVTIGRSFGDVWQLGVRTRAERVELTEIELDAPTEVFEDSGPDNLTGVALTLTRTTVDAFTRPSRGTRVEVSFEQVGALGGDFNFSKAELDYTLFLTLDEDFLGRKSILKLTSSVGYIFGSRSPTYERFYRGGRTFRGFDFREISPKGVLLNGLPSDDPVGGDWMFFAGAQYEVPLFQETITGVVFIDSGTVTADVGFSEYRVSAGFGVRLYIGALGPVPIAFDFGFPIMKESEDETRVLSFSAELPF